MKFIILVILFLSSACCHGSVPRLECEKKIGEIKIYGKVIKRYQLRGAHFPPGERYRLFVKWYNGEEAETLLYQSDEKGRLFLSGEEQKEPLYALCPLKRGERVSFLMRSERDPHFFVTTSIVPFPLVLKKRGISLELELLSAEGERFMVHGEGFNPREHIELQCYTQKKMESVHIEANVLGFIDVPIAFPVEEGQWNKAQLTIVRKTRKMTFPIVVGSPALEYVGGCCLEIR